MNYILLGASSLIISLAFLLLFSTFPDKAAVFPKLITYLCFLLPGTAAVIMGYKNNDHNKISMVNIKKSIESFKAISRTKSFGASWLLFLLTVLFVIGTAKIGFFPSTIIYFLVVLLLLYRMPLKSTLIYTLSSFAFLYVFFALIFNVQA